VSTPTPQTQAPSSTSPTVTISTQPTVTSPTSAANSIVYSAIQSFDEDEEVVLLAGLQGQVVAVFELNARLEDFELENLTLDS
jgi:hypothetical protein